MAANVAPVLTMRDAIAQCGVNDVVVAQGMTQAQKLASELFMDDFEQCANKTKEDLLEDSMTRTY